MFSLNRRRPMTVAVYLVGLAVLLYIGAFVYLSAAMFTGSPPGGQVEQDRCVGQYGVISPCP